MSFFDDWVEPFLTGDLPGDVPAHILVDMLGGVNPLTGEELTIEEVERRQS